MGDRKYRQRGYMDDERDRAPKKETPKPGPRGPAERREGPRTYNMPGFREVFRCSRCGDIITAAVTAESRCGKCGVDLHACAQCASFSPGSRFECMQPVQVRIAPKDARNTCTFFAPRTTVERETHSTAPSSARKAFDDLFK